MEIEDQLAKDEAEFDKGVISGYVLIQRAVGYLTVELNTFARIHQDEMIRAERERLEALNGR